MSISARLFIEDQEYNILEFDLKFNQEVDFMGNPNSNFKGGHFDIKLETIKSPLLLQWMLDSDSMKRVKIVIPSRFGTSKSRNIELLDTYCINNNKSFNSTDKEPLTTSITLSPASMIENGEVVFSKNWRVTDPTPKATTPVKDNDTEKKLIIGFDAKNSDIKNGVFGFDKIPDDYKKTLTSNTAIFEKEYNPIQVYGEQYFPVWVSMRKDQKITLELDFLKRKNEKLYQTIEFESNPDFTFSPTNLKDAKEVTITCNNNNPNTLQLKLLGDNDPVGAINFFYPEPKKVDLDWRILELTGKNSDEKSILRKITKENFSKNIKKAFHPLLIDIDLKNSTAVDLTKQNVDFEKYGFIMKTKTKDNEFLYINDNRKESLVSVIQGANPPSTNALTMYFINRRCILPTEVSKLESNPEASINLTGGFSPTGTGVAYGVLELGGSIIMDNMIHELLHAVGLEHIFKGAKHVFKQKSTNNFMDYFNNKEVTQAWQWKEVYNWFNSHPNFVKK